MFGRPYDLKFNLIKDKSLIQFSYLFVCFFFSFAENPKDWSDHALWWPTKNVWLTRTRSTLDQCGVHADALLHFTPMHKILRVQVCITTLLLLCVTLCDKKQGLAIFYCQSMYSQYLSVKIRFRKRYLF